jgi:two-component system response regulator GlrR
MSSVARILVIDDDREILKTFSAALKGTGYVVETAETGKDAIEKAKANFYNLALIDIRLPDMEGIELLTALVETTPKMVKIIVTGYPSLQNAVEAVNKGADGYIIKPANMADLLTKVKQHLEKQEKAKRYDQEKIKEFIETRIKESDTRENVSPSKRSDG